MKVYCPTGKETFDDEKTEVTGLDFMYQAI
jgi:hypothetical protein